jgi:hypothetical protein
LLASSDSRSEAVSYKHPELWILPRIVTSSSLPSSDLLSEESAVSILIQLWRGSLVEKSQALDILNSSHHTKRALPSSDLLSQDECSLCLDSAVARQSLTASNCYVKLQVLFLLQIYFQRISAVSILIQLWRGSLVGASQALDILNSSHHTKLALPSSDLLSQDECSLCLDSAVARQSLTNIPSFGYCCEL